MRLGFRSAHRPIRSTRRGKTGDLPPFHPRVLARTRLQPFIELLRANMRHAGALRIDHVMGLKRLFCIPRALPDGGGAYVNYDFDAMLGIVALESVRNRCMIVGEDLGTVPDGFRERTTRSARLFVPRPVLRARMGWSLPCARRLSGRSGGQHRNARFADPGRLVGKRPMEPRASNCSTRCAPPGSKSTATELTALLVGGLSLPCAVALAPGALATRRRDRIARSGKCSRNR